MIKITKKMRKTIAAYIVLAAIIGSFPGITNAGILDWLKVGKSNTIGSEMSSNDLFLSTESAFATKTKEQKEKSILDVIGNSAIVQANNPYGINIVQRTANIPKTSNENVVREITIPASAYSSTPDQTDDSPFITANGAYVYDGLVAANFLPFGTKIKIPGIYGNKIFTVEDRMNKRYWHKVDIWFPDRQSALEFGLRTVTIQILES